MLFDLHPHLLHHGNHFRAKVGPAVHWWHREVAALASRTMAKIALFHLDRGHVGASLALELHESVVHPDGKAKVGTDGELGPGPARDGVGDAGGAHGLR